MQRLSKRLERLEDSLARKTAKGRAKFTKKLARFWPLYLAGLYFYGLLINSIDRGIAQTFRGPDDPPVQSLWEWNPILNLAAIFTPCGLGVTVFCVIMVILITKKGYNWFSGYKFKRDPRGFDILPDGTHGTGGWMDEKDLDRMMLTGTAEQLTGPILGKLMESEDKDQCHTFVSPRPDNGLAGHILVYGSTGTGKSRGFVVPFILQAARREQKESLVILDPKGELFEKTSQYLRDQGYVVKCYNLLDMEHSDGFNCFSDIESDKTLVQSIAEVIIKNTSNSAERQDFWEKAEMNLLMALLHLVVDSRDEQGRLLPIEQRSLGQLYKILSEKSFSEIDALFVALKKRDPQHPALAPYGIFKLANHQILGNIAIGLGNRLSVFQDKLVDTITRYNDIDLTLPGQRPCAYFCIISAQDSSLEFLSSMFITLLFSRLGNYARRYGVNGRLPVKVNMLLEEFSNCAGQLMDFTKTISFCRSQNIDCQLLIQGIAQLADRYDHNQWEEIIGNCDTQIFLGCNDAKTAEYVSAKCTKVSIRTTSATFPMQPLFSPIYNNTRPASEGRQTTSRDLMMPDEIMGLDNAKNIILLRGQKPLMLYKITPEDLPASKELHPVQIADYRPRWRDLEEELEPSAQPAPAPEEAYAPQPAPTPEIPTKERKYEHYEFIPPVTGPEVGKPSKAEEATPDLGQEDGKQLSFWPTAPGAVKRSGRKKQKD